MGAINLKDIPKGFGTIPWWIWNGRMEYSEIRRQLHLMKEARMDGWMLWARFGLEMQYLSHEFMTKFRFAVQESARLGLEVWIYDEYAWPSGNAQNQVGEVNPEYRMRVLSAFIYNVEGGNEHVFKPDWGANGYLKVPLAKGSGETTDALKSECKERISISPYLFPSTDPEGNRLFFAPRIERVIAVPIQDGIADLENVRNISDAADDLCVRWNAPAGTWRVYTLISRDFGSLIDHLNPDAVRTFINLTHEKYKRSVGEFFGTTIKGFFSDETRMFRDTQHRFSEPTIVWTKNLFDRLQGADIDNLDAAMAAVFTVDGRPQTKALRLQFWKKITDFYSDAFYRQLTEWAETHGMVYTGDCFSEDSLNLMYIGDYFKCVSHYHMPGLDSLGLPSWRNREVFKSPKFPSSLAHMRGEKTRCLAEGPGLLGWSTTMEGLRRVADWLYVFGVNRLVPNAFHYTIWHEQLYETPSYFFQWTLWPFYKDWDNYVKRLGYVLTRGCHVARVAVLYPTETLLAGFRPIVPANRSKFTDGERSERCFQTVVSVAYGLLCRQIDFDYVNSTFLEGQDVSSGTVTVGEESINMLVVAGHTMIRRTTTEKLKEFIQGGGKIVWVGPLSVFYEDGLESVDFVEWVKGQVGCIHIESFEEQNDLETKLEMTISGIIELPVKISSLERNKFAVHMRKDGKDEYLFIAYFGDKASEAEIIVSGWNGMERCDMLTGEWHATDVHNGQLRQEFTPYMSCLLRKSQSNRVLAVREKEIILRDKWEVQVLDNNLFLPEPVLVTTEWVNRRAWEAMLRYNIEFTLEVAHHLKRCFLVMDEVEFFLERKCICVTVNGQSVPVSPSPIIDPGLVAADLVSELSTGNNKVRVQLDHSDYDSQVLLMTKHRSPAPQVRARIFGQFLVRNGSLCTMPESLGVVGAGDLTNQGLKLYSGRILYRQRFMMERRVTLTHVHIDDLANHAIVRIDGEEIGRILWHPFRMECHHNLATGEHKIEIEVTNTQGNQMFEQQMPLGLLGKVVLGIVEEGKIEPEPC